MVARRSGFSLIEGLVAAMIMGIALVGMFALWIGLFSRFLRAREIAEAGELARAEVERARAYGANNLPKGTYSAGTGTGTWTGAFDPTANSGAGTWTSGLSSYYDVNGTRLASSSSAEVKFRLQGTFSDSGVVGVTGGSYTLDMTSKRAFQVTVWTTSDNAAVIAMGTVLVQGGL